MEPIDKRIRDGAKAISQDLAGPAGQIALDRVVVRHLVWFDLCQGRGMSWPQIAAMLNATGAGRENGLPFANGHLSAVVWRQRQKAKMGPAEARGVPVRLAGPPGPASTSGGVTDALSAAVERQKQSTKSTKSGWTPTPSLPRQSPAREDRNSSPVRASGSPDGSPTDSVRIRAAMNRAAALRGGGVDDQY